MFRTILVPLDGSTLAEQALGTAIAIAGSSGAKLELVLAHAGTTYDGLLNEAPASPPEEHIYIQGLIADIEHRFGIRGVGAVVPGIPVEAIARRAADVNADLIVMTSHGRTGFSRAWLGSVADGVVRQSTIPVLIERPSLRRNWRHDTRRIATMLLTLDRSVEATAILEPAFALASAIRATPILARVVRPVAADFSDAGIPVYPPVVDAELTQRELAEAREELQEVCTLLQVDTGLEVGCVVKTGEHVAATILDMARESNADLIAMSTRSRGTARVFLGSVTDKVLRGTDLPLLVLHPRPSAIHPGEASGIKAETA